MRGRDVVRAIGDVDAPQYLRSAAKPFQALAALEVLLGSGFELSDAEISVISASHSGQPAHVALVRDLLRRAGIPESQLLCGSHAPTHAPSAATLVRAGEEPCALHNTCSGKHAAMLIATRALGASIDEYLEPGQPLQVRNRAMLARFAEVRAEDVGVAVDGCSAPTFILSARAAARAFSNLMEPARVGYDHPAWRRWMAAIPREPLAYAGDGRPCTKLLTAAPDAVYPKIGAEGFYTVGVRPAGVGIATKIDDGSHRGTEALIATLLLELGLELPSETQAALGRMREVSLKNHRGLTIGRLEVTLP
jgi:L-asparaginase II